MRPYPALGRAAVVVFELADAVSFSARSTANPFSGDRSAYGACRQARVLPAQLLSRRIGEGRAGPHHPREPPERRVSHHMEAMRALRAHLGRGGATLVSSPLTQSPGPEACIRLSGLGCLRRPVSR